MWIYVILIALLPITLMFSLLRVQGSWSRSTVDTNPIRGLARPRCPRTRFLALSNTTRRQTTGSTWSIHSRSLQVGKWRIYISLRLDNLPVFVTDSNLGLACHVNLILLLQWRKLNNYNDVFNNDEELQGHCYAGYNNEFPYFLCI